MQLQLRLPAPLTQKAQTSINVTLVFAIALTILTWGSAFPAIRAALKAYTPEHLAVLRHLVASFVLIGYALMIRMPLPKREHLGRIALLGFFGMSVYHVALNAGGKGVSASIASLIIAAVPVFVALLARAFLNERFTRWGWLGIATCFSGVATIALTSGGNANGLQISPSALLILLAAVAMSFYFVGQKPFFARGDYTPLQLTTYAIVAGTVFLLVFLPGLSQEMQVAPLNATLAIIYMGIFPSAIGYISWAYVLSKLPASVAGSFLYVVPVVATSVAWLWLGEAPAGLTLIGGTMVLCGVILVNTRGKQPKPTTV